MARRIDDSHHAFKRGTTIGPGPRKRVITQEGDWACHAGKKTRTHYVQVCRWVGGKGYEGKKKITVKTSIKKKRARNREYRAFEASNKRIRAFQAKGARRGYRCRKTPKTWCK